MMILGFILSLQEENANHTGMSQIPLASSDIKGKSIDEIVIKYLNNL